MFLSVFFFFFFCVFFFYEQTQFFGFAKLIQCFLQVADFGLAKFVGRKNEDDLIVTRLVGTLGYLPPEFVKELQVTTKTDVFVFGVVLAELITGQRALIHDNREPNKMKSLLTLVNKIFQDKEPETALLSIIDGNLKGSYHMEDVYKECNLHELRKNWEIFLRS